MKNTASILSLSFFLLLSLFLGIAIHPAVGVTVAAFSVLGACTNMLPGGTLAISMISGTPITFIKKQAEKVIINPAFDDPELKDIHMIIPGIQSDTQVAFMGRISKVTKLDPGCGSGKTTKAISLSEKFWTMKRMKVWSSQCSDDLEQTFFVWGLKPGSQRKDLTSGDFAKYALELMTAAVKEDALRIAWFGDTAVDTVANGGTLLLAGDVAHYNQLDGFWKKIFTAVTGTTMTKAYTVTANAAGSFLLQDSTLATDEAYKAINALVKKADKRMDTVKGRKVIYLTDSMWQNWLDYKESKLIDSSFVRQGEYFSTDKYRGVTIVSLPFWDRWIRSDFQNGTVYNLPHRGLISYVENIQIGLDTASITDFRVWYNDDTEETNWKGLYKMDVQIPMDFLMTVFY